jgi:RNA polymerase sigma factor (sigma-70 family)
VAAGIARGVLANSRRRDGRQDALVARLINERPADPGVDPGELDPVVVRALASLNDRNQELLLLVAWEKLNTAEIAHMLKISRGAVAVRVHRARRRLQTALAAEEQGRSRDRERTSEMEVS